MRILIAAAISGLLLPNVALSADLDLGMLRGTSYGTPDLAPVADWSGVYAGGFAGYAQSNFENKSGSNDLIANYFRSTVIENEAGVSNLLQLKSKDARDTAFGGFIGYSFQYDEAVLGFEADYTSTKLRGTSSDAIGRAITTSDGNYNMVGLQGSGTTELQGYGTVRARAGYTWGSLMPFVTAGLALGQLKTTNAATIQYAAFNVDQNTAYLAGTGPYPNSTGYSTFAPAAPTNLSCAAGASCLNAPQTFTKSKSTVAIGYTAGVGIEVMVTQNIFLRGEYQYAFFNDYDGHKFNTNVARAGAGVKF